MGESNRPERRHSSQWTRRSRIGASSVFKANQRQSSQVAVVGPTVAWRTAAAALSGRQRGIVRMRGPSAQLAGRAFQGRCSASLRWHASRGPAHWMVRGVAR
jgi:hypothetical protein